MKKFLYKSNAVLGLALLLLVGCNSDEVDFSQLTDIDTPYITLTPLKEENIISSGAFGIFIMHPNWLDPDQVDVDIDFDHPAWQHHIILEDINDPLLYGVESEIQLAMSYNTTPLQRVEFPMTQGFLDLQINQQFDDDLSELDFFDPPVEVIYASPGEIIELAFFAVPSVQTFTGISDFCFSWMGTSSF